LSKLLAGQSDPDRARPGS